MGQERISRSQVRAQQRAAAAARARRNRLLWRGGFLVGAILLIFFGLRAFGVLEPGGTASDLNAPQYRASRGDAVGTQVPGEGNAHIRDGQRVNYGTTPPTSGSHWQRWAEWGIKDAQEPNERTTHNLEHGGIVIAYKDLSSAEVEQLKALVRTLRSSGYPKIILEPYQDLTDAKVALTAWQWIVKLPAYDDAQLVRFVKAHYAGPDAPEPNGP